jgi:hypothetical protein
MPTETIPFLDSLTSLGAAGFMGAMWLWERRTSQAREQQIDEAHARIMADRVQLDALVDLVERNTQVITRLSASINCQPKVQVKP